MRFLVKRTSSSDESKPCPGATPGEYVYIDERVVDDPKKIPGEGAKWYERGENHRVEDGHIKRDFPGEAGWFLELSTLEDLIALQAQVGEELVIGPATLNPGIMEIEIYDTYRE